MRTLAVHRERMRELRLKHAGVRCSRCLRMGVLDGTSRCALCLAFDLERKPWLAGMRHDTLAHAGMLELSRRPRSRCAVSDLALERLRRGGPDGRTYSLQVDRISDERGYVHGNMRLLACRLNRAKQGLLEVPKLALEHFLEDLGERVKPVRAFMPAGAY